MNFYNFHIGDFVAATVHLSPMEELAYRRLLDMYYDTEQPIPLGTERVARRLRMDVETVKTVLADYFTLTDEGYRNSRCDAEIAAYQRRAETARSNGKAGGRRKKTQSVPSRNPPATGSKANQEPITNNQEPNNPLGHAAPADGKPADYPDEFESAWMIYPKRAGGNSKKDAFKAWNARIAQGVEPAVMAAGVRRYAAYLTATGKIGTEYVKQAATFFGPAGHYAEPWEAPSGAAGPAALSKADYGTNGQGGVFKL